MSSTEQSPTREPERPGRVQRTVWRMYAALPRSARMALVRRFTPNYTVGAVCVVEYLPPDAAPARILVLRQLHRHGWTLPGGLMDRGETPQEALTRELAEETGLRVEPAEPLTTVVDPRDRRVDVIFHVRASEPFAVVASSEAVRSAWLQLDQLGALDHSTTQVLAAFRAAQDDVPRLGRISR